MQRIAPFVPALWSLEQEVWVGVVTNIELDLTKIQFSEVAKLVVRRDPGLQLIWVESLRSKGGVGGYWKECLGEFG